MVCTRGVSVNKAFPTCVQCNAVNDGDFDSCKVCTIKECRKAIKQLNWLLNHFAKVVKAAKKWQAAKVIAMPLTVDISKEAGIVDKESRTVEVVEAENGIVIALGDLDREGIKVKI